MKYVHSNEMRIHINAPVDAVWVALTNPEHIKKYFFGAHTTTDWLQGHPIIFDGEWKGVKYRDKGTVLEYKKNKQLIYEYWSSISDMEDLPENYAVITYEVQDTGQSTNLIVSQDNIPNEVVKEHYLNNWRKVLDDLKKLVEEQTHELLDLSDPSRMNIY
jgi:uncharacterized protein YndB with AHSA1/START domain